MGQHGSAAPVGCPVFGKDEEAIFKRNALVPCEFEALKEEEQEWACMLNILSVK